MRRTGQELLLLQLVPGAGQSTGKIEQRGQGTSARLLAVTGRPRRFVLTLVALLEAGDLRDVASVARHDGPTEHLLVLFSLRAEAELLRLLV